MLYLFIRELNKLIRTIPEKEIGHETKQRKGYSNIVSIWLRLTFLKHKANIINQKNIYNPIFYVNKKYITIDYLTLSVKHLKHFLSSILWCQLLQYRLCRNYFNFFSIIFLYIWFTHFKYDIFRVRHCAL